MAASFTDEEISSHGAYRGPGYLGYFLGLGIQIAVLLMLARGPLQRLLAATESWRGGWVTQALVAAVAVTLVLALVALPMGLVRGYFVSHAWDLSTQSAGAWISDQVRGLLIGLVIAMVSALAFFGVIKWRPGSWWLIGWVTFSLLTLLLTFAWPVLVAPLFNDFTPLPDGSLRDRVLAVADEAGVEVGDVLVADASKRSTAENAYVAGLFGSKQLVLYDTLVNNGSEDETMFVVSHELGHKVHNHVLKGVAISIVGLGLGFLVLRGLASIGGLWSWAGASGVGDVKALPLLLLFSLGANLLLVPAGNIVSRHFEAEADRVAVSLTDDSDTAVRVFRRLAFSNISDLRPNPVIVWLFGTHPPTRERIESVLGVPAQTP